MHVVSIIPYYVWVHKTTGRKVSVSGALPWVSESEKQNWEMQQQGFTWQMSNGTRGFGRPAANTVEEAKELANKINKGKPYKVRV